MADEMTQEDQPTGNMGADPAVKEDASSDDTRSYTQWRRRIERCKTAKLTLSPDWDTNVDYRRGKVFATDTDEDRIAVNLDWPQTKAKIAALFSQVPSLQASSKWKMFSPVARLYARAVDARLMDSKVDVAMDEMMPDVINKAGIAACIVGYESRTKKKQVGTSLHPDNAGQPVDLNQFQPEQVQQAVAQGLLKVDNVDQVVDKRFYITRISPNDLLWPTEFTGSDFDDAPWVGHTDTMTWAEAKNCFGLDDEQKDKVVGAGTRSDSEDRANNVQNIPDDEPDTVQYDEIFYWAYLFDPDEMYYKKIKRMVFVAGLTKPVIDEDYKGQKFDEQSGKYSGVCKFPIRVLTLTYLSDESVPPSDSSIGRPQVDELIRSRTQMVLQRDRSQPIRWYDVNRVAQEVQDQLMRGTWQGFVPVNGDGSRAVGEVARAMYPREDFEFDRVAKQDLMEQWQIGPNQMGMYAQGENSATEAKYVQSGFNSRIGQERGRVVKCYVGIADVMAGLMSLYDGFSDMLEPDELQQLFSVWKPDQQKASVVFSVRPDSTVLLDSDARIQKILRTMNMVGKSGFVPPDAMVSMVQEILDLSGVDAQAAAPDNSKPEPLNISIRSYEDLHDPIFLSLLFKSQQISSPDELEAAKKMLQQAAMPAAPPQPPPGPGGPGGPVPPDAPPTDGGPGVPPNPDWNVMPRVTKRADELGG